MGDEEIVPDLEKAMKWEEEFMMDYDSQEIWTLLETLEPEKFEKVKRLLKENLADTERHYNTVRDLIKQIGGKTA